jgi:hypothetical protein
LYPAVPDAAARFAEEGDLPGGLMVAVRLADLVSPLKSGAPLEAGARSALAVAGTERIRTGELVVFCKVTAVAAGRVRGDGKIQAEGSPCGHATLGPLEERLDAQAGTAVIGGIAARAVLEETYVKGNGTGCSGRRS